MRRFLTSVASITLALAIGVTSASPQATQGTPALKPAETTTKTIAAGTPVLAAFSTDIDFLAVNSPGGFAQLQTSSSIAVAGATLVPRGTPVTAEFVARDNSDGAGKTQLVARFIQLGETRIPLSGKVFAPKPGKSSAKKGEVVELLVAQETALDVKAAASGPRLVRLPDGKASQEPMPPIPANCGLGKANRDYAVKHAAAIAKGKKSWMNWSKYYSNLSFALVPDPANAAGPYVLSVMIKDSYFVLFQPYYPDSFNFDKLLVPLKTGTSLFAGVQNKVLPVGVPNGIGQYNYSSSRSMTFYLPVQVGNAIIAENNEEFPVYYVDRNGYAFQCPVYLSSSDLKRVMHPN